MPRRLLAGTLLILLALPARLIAEEKVDLDAVTKIRDEGFNRSKVMDLASQLCDEIGPRVTGSPNMKKANEWAKKQLGDWGLQNAHLESFAPFGRGWVEEAVSVRMVSPSVVQIPAEVKAWTPGSNGPKRAKAVKAKLETDEDLAKWKGKLAGVIVLTEEPKEIAPHEKGDAKRYSKDELEKIEQFEARDRRRFDRDEILKRREFQKKLRQFLLDEKAVAEVSTSRGDDGTIFVQGGGSYRKDDPEGLPAVVLSSEHYGRISRLLDRKIEVELEVDVKASFTPEDPDAASNVIAEIPGTDRKDEVVMLGAHLDSWHSGTGATDNGAGSVVAMEAVRILKALGLKPRRTIRIGLWGGEEQGLLGSRGYVSAHFASRPEPADPSERDLPSFARRPAGPLTFKPEYRKLSGYFNLDNGSGKIRGIYAQENAAVRPIFEAWLTPFHDLGATAVTLRNTGGTDHQAFDGVGLPGFQFVQDELDYGTRTHHSNMDVYERLQRADLMQASVILASFVWHAAMRDELLPRKPLPAEPPRTERKDETKPEKKPEAPVAKPATK